ncbi:DUF5677 domain-containing protein [Planctomyces sp. SH-PL62]|uniref:DUF5677 domain-containing protein n=1 Tax=Planctomyces sp. SH-PL62 TaxID=1636152 RepID=UPI00078E067F|nr:DUF5677 domain-containing protein [Planctomyces sp. SH-PL62]AMV40474.1 hypothetical protein VT85_23795 [Planctomyces sp. SH-PL62]
MIRRFRRKLRERLGLNQSLPSINEDYFKFGSLIGESDIENIDMPLNSYINIPDNPSPLLAALDSRGDEIVQAMISSSRKMLSNRAAIRRRYSKHIQSIWGNSITSLKMLIAASLETGELFNNQYQHQANEDGDLLFIAVIRLHARCCLLAQEVSWLLEGGFPSAAMSRWRTLHEAAVVSLFISGRGQDVAERYLLHDHKDAYDYAKIFQEQAAALGPDYEPLSAEEMERHEDRKRDLCSRFGDSYWKQWGWAANALNIKNPHFTAIEAAVGLEYLRPFFKMACHSNHAGSRGIWFDIGLPAPDMPIMLAGPSDAGFYDPGVSTAISITHASRAMLGLRASETAVVSRLVIEKLTGLCEAAFSEAEALYQEEFERRGEEKKAPPA